MDLKERLAIIEKKAKNDKEKAAEKEKSVQDKTQEALCKVESLKSRIEDVITVANKCIEEGIELPYASETSKFGYGDGYHSYDFFSDGIHHHVGLMSSVLRGCYREISSYPKIEYLGIVEGGACGIWDFYTNGTKTFLKHEKDGSIKGAELKYLNDFLNEFDIFEKAFYKWVDSLAD